MMISEHEYHELSVKYFEMRTRAETAEKRVRELEYVINPIMHVLGLEFLGELKSHVSALKYRTEKSELREKVRSAMVLFHESDEYFEAMNILAEIVGIPKVDWSSLKMVKVMDIIEQSEQALRDEGCDG